MKQNINKRHVKDIDAKIAKRLRMRRILLGLGQKQLAASLDVSVQQIQKYENGTNRVPSGNLYILSKFLGVAMDYFVKDEENFLDIINNNNLSEKKLVSLNKNFSKIKNQNLRNKMLELITSMTYNLIA